MVQLTQTFDATQVEPNTGDFSPMPTAWYNAMLTETEQVATNKAKEGLLEANKNDWMAACKFTLAGNEKFDGRVVFNNLNLGLVSSPEAMEIAYRELSAICHGTGKLQINSTDELLNLPLQIHLKLVPAVLMPDGVTEKYPAKNEVNGYKPLAPVSNAPTAPLPVATPGATPAATPVSPPAPIPVAVKEKPPWEK